jgi:hypothetical protein
VSTDRLIAITHGRPDDATLCGRPLYVRHLEGPSKEAPLAIQVYVCPLHGDVTDKKGPTAPHSFFHQDARRRGPHE